MTRKRWYIKHIHLLFLPSDTTLEWKQEDFFKGTNLMERLKREEDKKRTEDSHDKILVTKKHMKKMVTNLADLKNVQLHKLLGKCKSKLQWDTTSHLLEWLLSTRQIITCVGEVVEKRDPSFTTGRKVDWYSQYGKHSGDS